VTPIDWNNVCWAGSIQEQLMDVQQACNRAVQSDSSNPQIRDSRGVYRARTGDFDGAVEDFQIFVSTNVRDVSDKDKRTRRKWIEELKKKNNPFTSDELLQIRKEDGDGASAE
jgi:hypothetical protein